ncbi:unnamed protein product [Heterosigma akashiwo]|mmetsp:Transcript_18464/g.25371  ORF Transcript_18464/g.25371 Transcript_18464/m.25371 type:complete len:87 (+) Transcript_18464:93-353(+)
MGRRRAKQKKIKTKKKQVVPTTFKCPFCCHDDVVECKMDWNRGKGDLTCRICGANFQASINYLTEPIDLFSEWIDACEAEQENLQS